jgi:hypothetical protein
MLQASRTSQISQMAPFSPVLAEQVEAKEESNKLEIYP